MECGGIWLYQGARVLAVECGDVVGRHFADVDLEVQEPAWEERDIARVQNVDVWSPYFDFKKFNHYTRWYDIYLIMPNTTREE